MPARPKGAVHSTPKWARIPSVPARRSALLALVLLCAIILPSGGVALSLTSGQPPPALLLAGQVAGLLLKMLAVSSLLIGLLSIPALRRTPAE